MGLTVTLIPTAPAVAVVLHDGNRTPIADGIDPTYQPKLDFTVQETALFRAPWRFLATRNNAITAWNFTSTRTFTNEQVCSDYIGNLATTIPPSGELQLTWKYGGMLWVRYHKTVKILSVTPTNLGKSASFNYALKINSPYSLTP